MKFLLVIACSLASVCAQPSFRAGVSVVDISPTNFPVIANAMFTERVATETVDRLEARAIVLDDSSIKIAIVVVDSCMVPRDLIDRAKSSARDATGIPTERMLVSATHTHSAPSAMGCLGSRVDTNYAALLPGKITEAIVRANGNLRLARIGWTVIDDWDHTFNRRWIRRADRMLEDPFGERNVRAHMHPGHQSPDAIGPSGPVDPGLSILVVQTPEGRPLALLANYSQHYYTSPLLSSDYYGRFRNEMARLLNADSNFVAVMSQGTSGDQMWMDYGAPRKEIGYEAYAKEVAARVHAACKSITFTNFAPLRIAQRKLHLRYRTPEPERIAWARKMAESLGDRLPQQLPEIYALEAIYLHERPETELILQALRIGTLGITAIPNEVYALTGLKLKAQSPLQPTLNIELANGAEGYIPPPEQHKLGGYTTWPARTAGLEVEAEPQIVETLLSLLEEVSGQPRRTIETTHGPYAQAILASRPRAYWRFEEMSGTIARDSSPHNLPAHYSDGVALFLSGPGSGEGVSPAPALRPSNFSGPSAINRAVHIAGGSVSAKLELPATYTLECWFWNGFGSSRLFEDLKVGEKLAYGDHPGVNPVLLRTWHHLALVRQNDKVDIYLDGRPEISGRAAGKRNASFIMGKDFEGKLDEVAIFDRALTADEIAAHIKAANLVR